MKRAYTLWLTLLALLCIPGMAAWGQMNSYYFAHSTGDPLPMDGANVLFAGQQFSNIDDANFFIDIGFPFRFDGSDYDVLTVSSNGSLFFGFMFDAAYENSMQGAPSYPALFPFWDDIRIMGGAFCSTPTLSYRLDGVAPNRVLIVQWEEVSLCGFTPNNMPLGTFQARLYETTNTIEFWYGTMSSCDVCNLSGSCFNTSATVGIASSPDQFISVSFNDDPTENRSEANDFIDLLETPIKENTLLVFGECSAILNGRVGQDNGGTATVEEGDTFFEGFVTQIGESSIYRPFNIRMVSPICAGTYSLFIDGPAGSDYYFGTPGTQDLTMELVNGEVHIPEITFQPTDAGVREATLYISSMGLKRSFRLAAYAPHVNYIGHVAEGGTPKMTSGDVLLAGKRIARHSSADYEPFSLVNVSSIEVPVEYTIEGGFGQYSISPGLTLGPGEETTPVITFNAVGFGVVNAQLTVNAGGEVRRFTLAAISAAPGGEFRLGSALLDTGSTLFTNTNVCVGSEVRQLRVDMVNTGYGPFTINGAAFYETDTTIRQGTPKYAFRRDAEGDLIPSSDYAVSLEPIKLPYVPGTNPFPITLQEGESQTIYISFIGTASGKRFARGYLFTNSENTAAADPEGVVREGIVAFDVFGRGAGSRLSGDLTGRAPKAVVFPAARLGSSSEAVLKLANSGACSLRISLDKLQITAGDVEEFSIVTGPQGFIDTNGDLVLAPGETDQVVLSFKPMRTGSRRASLRIVTNDSSIYIPNVSERGVYYADLFGSGGTDMYAQSIDFGQALIDGDASEHRHDISRIVNTMDVTVTISSIEIEGVNPTDFMQDATRPWPALPYVLKPGEELELGVVFAPKGGAPGGRTATLMVKTTSLPKGVAELKGVAGVRTMVVSPSNLSFVAMTVGKQQRRIVRITNTGTMPMDLSHVEVTGPEAASFQLGRLERLQIPAGQSELLEVTYAPAAVGPVNATLTVFSNATDAPKQVLLSGTSFMPKGPDDPQTPVTGIEDGVGRNPNLSTSGLESETTISGVTLYQSMPNPAQDVTEIRYNLVKDAVVELALYDAQGRIVRVLENGLRSSGDRAVRVDVRELSNGTYFYRLKINGQTLSRTMTIAR